MYPAKINFPQIQPVHWNLLQHFIFPGYNAIPTLQHGAHVGIAVVSPPIQKKEFEQKGQHCSLKEEQIYSSSSNKGSLRSSTPWKSHCYPRLSFTKKKTKQLGVLVLLLCCVPCLWHFVLIWFSVWVQRFILGDEEACLDSIESFLTLLSVPLFWVPHQYKVPWEPPAQLMPSASIPCKGKSLTMDNLGLWSLCSKMK